ncbi:Pleiotropic regulatory protein [Bacillus sonorensis]|uniref:DegT/DnrJ/EryC1/StrS family aminotransferase n=1 Tax=Bacillus sonorensis TaxID=119858 RepID=UPI0018CEF55E|nr:DegT/DnrJ/EryC1/StrS family aminotransferase [Bacillus sonorensis]MBG9916340.1 Pleiotropic regulatory protein [Bacillus sonorensis]GIN68754.1 aminotransferase DegT/DnrJ/EryC1/StrS family protein [Bacillus sonorensis]
MIPLINLKRQFQTVKHEILKEFERVLDSGQYILGPKVKELEKKIAEKLGVRDAVGVANGTDALVLTLEAYGIGKGDEVITTPFTFFASAEAVSRVGATPVFADVDPETYNLDPAKIEERITPATKAVIPVHIFGQPADMDDIMAVAKKHGLLVIEDACQAFGATYNDRPVGSLGDAACFSFFPTKNLGTLGDGGMVTISDSEAAQRVRTLRTHGTSKKYFHDKIGFNSRLDELHAAALIIFLEKIDGWNEQRRKIAGRYREALAEASHLTLPKEKEDRSHIYHLFCIGAKNRREIMQSLEAQQIHTGVYYPCCLHLQDVYASLPYKKGDFPVAESLSETLFAIPMDPFLPSDEQDQIISVLLASGGGE